MIRINGIVSTATRAKKRLSEGIPSSEVSQFKSFVKGSLQTIEKLCHENNIKPSQLLIRSRKAYQFLKTIDLDNLPVVNSSRNRPTEPKSFRVKNLVKEVETVQHRIWEITHALLQQQEYLTALHEQITNQAANVETVLETGKVTVADLTPKSRSAYAWLKFLSQRETLEQHIRTVGQLKEISTEICTEKGIEQKVRVELYNSACLWRYKTVNQQTKLILSEGFIEASPEIFRVALQIALLGQNKQLKTELHQFSLTKNYQRIQLELDLIAEIHTEVSSGKNYNLKEIFSAVNAVYFGGELSQPRLAWATLPPSRYAYYERVKDKVVFSTRLDNKNIPVSVLQFIMYHELLHKDLECKFINNRQRSHTPEFRQKEKQFKLYREVQPWLDELALL